MQKELIFFLTHRGFYAEIIGLMNAKLYCEKRNIKLYINTDRFIYGDIRKYLNCDVFDFGIPKYPNPLISYPWTFNIPEYTSIFEKMLHSSNSWEEIRPLAIKLFSSVKPSTLKLPDVYDAIHIRRGDKTFEWPGKESEFKHASEYIAKLDDDDTPIYIMTDDYGVIEEIKKCTNKTILFKVESDSKGWHSYYFVNTVYNDNKHDESFKKFSKENDNERHKSTLMLLEETWICAHSRKFIGTFSSNVSKFIKTIHKNPENCISLDEEWRNY